MLVKVLLIHSEQRLERKLERLERRCRSLVLMM